MIKRAIISVSDKTGIVNFAKELTNLGIEIISTGGTAKALKAAGIKVVGISDVTGFPECLDGRVKTLHPKVHAGILAMRDNEEHMNTLKELHIDPIDMVVINLYPFKQTILKPDVVLEDAIENIDIGGPTMIRAAAKNYKDVTVVVDPQDYDSILEEIKTNGDVKAETKFKLAYKVFNHTSQYDTLIASYLRKQLQLEGMPENFTMTFEKAQDLRYGENPHQNAIFYKEIGANPGSVVEAKQINGKELSFNNINDVNGAIELLKEFPDEPTIVAVKHTNPCGVASAATIFEAYQRAYESDPVSIFGGIVASNKEIDKATAEEIAKIFLEIVIAPSFTEEAKEVLCKKKNLRVLELPTIMNKENGITMKKVQGGLLVQELDNAIFNEEELKVVTKNKPSDSEMEDLLFAWKIVKHTKSNAIVIAKNKQTVGVGPGQTNRIWAAKHAIEQGGENVKGAVMASDAFFPFGDCAEAAADAGIVSIIQPGGSIRDAESIEVCDNRGISMLFTGMRHFKH